VVVLALLSLARASPAPAAEYAEGARAFAAGNYARAIALWRVAAWVDDDIDAQLQLSDLYYHAKRADDGSYAERVLKYVPKDVVEAYVWTYLAVINNQRFATNLPVATTRDTILAARFSKTLPALFNQMSTNERHEAEMRITYILASRGAAGFYRLGELYFACPNFKATSVLQGTFPVTDKVLCRQDQGANNPSVNVFYESPVDSLAYFMIAEELGHKYAGDAKKKVVSLLGENYTNFKNDIEKAADRLREFWEPTFEVYPKPHSDESHIDTLREEALARIGDNIRCAAFQEALRELGFYAGAVDDQCGPMTRKAMNAYQASIGGPVGELLPAQAVKLIRTAAVNGFAPSQFTLGYMYHFGYGVPVSYPRARSWFEKAANQRYPFALYNLGILYRDGLGVPVDFGKAATYFLTARDAGYREGPPNDIATRLCEVRWPDEGAKRGADCAAPPMPKKKPESAGQ
jgi:TPR repeat protein